MCVYPVVFHINITKIKSYISLTHGEGYGLPLFEAAYNGLPIIAPAWSGQCDFLYLPVKYKKSKKTKLKAKFSSVKYRIGPVPKDVVWDGVIQDGSSWCYPEEGSYKMCLKTMHGNIKNAQKDAKELQKWILKNFTEEKKYQEFVDSIMSVVGVTREEIDWSRQINQMQVL